MTVFLLCLLLMGLYNVTLAPRIFQALNPIEGILFFARHGGRSFQMLGFVVLCITGTESMYADLGHFGVPAVRYTWLLLCYPALMIQYLGQGAIILHSGLDPDVASNAFFRAIPVPIFWFVFVLATLATTVASQGNITGSMTVITQAIHRNCFPRVLLVHTSRTFHTRVYVPSVIVFLGIATIAVTVGFRTSANLTNAFGLTVCLIIVLVRAMCVLCAVYVIFTYEWHALCIITDDTVAGSGRPLRLGMALTYRPAFYWIFPLH
jgi:KUP system potassium uptake protein